MLLRLVLLGLFFWAIVRFVWRLFAFVLTGRTAVRRAPTDKSGKSIGIDDSQIQDADFKDL
jgi:hypothetical protein